jgi:hypothetical protein
MSTFVLGILVGIGAGYLLGGRLRNLAALRVPAWFLAVVWLALALQVALRWLTEEIGYAFLLTTYAVVAGPSASTSRPCSGRPRPPICGRAWCFSRSAGS